jgi:hypothetical protein
MRMDKEVVVRLHASFDEIVQRHPGIIDRYVPWFLVLRQGTARAQ